MVDAPTPVKSEHLLHPKRSPPTYEEPTLVSTMVLFILVIQHKPSTISQFARFLCLTARLDMPLIVP